MREEVGDLWKLPADVRCVTTNGDINTKGRAIMGSGCALEAKKLYPNIDLHFAKLLSILGHHVYPLWVEENATVVLSFPTKHNWKQPADINLIRRSCEELMESIEMMDHKWEGMWKRVLLPRPGCGAGQLAWEDVKPIIGEILDDRVIVVTY